MTGPIAIPEAGASSRSASKTGRWQKGLGGIICAVACAVGLIAASRASGVTFSRRLAPTGSEMTSPIEPGCDAKRMSVSSLYEDGNAARREQLAEAYKKMKKTPSPWSSGFYQGKPVPKRWHNLSWYDTFVMIHITNGPGENTFAHMGTAFPSWHRQLLQMFEDGMNEVMGNPCPKITQPYWGWTSGEDTRNVYTFTGRDGDQSFYSCVRDGYFSWPNYNITWTPGYYIEPGAVGQCLKRQISTWGVLNVDFKMASHMVAQQDIETAITTQRFDSFPWDASSLGSISFRNIVEGYSDYKNTAQGAEIRSETPHPFHGIHNIVHMATGLNMAQLDSPNDVLFWFHHGNMDRLYESWLQFSQPTYGSGAPHFLEVKSGPPSNETMGYPATIKKVFGANGSCYDPRDRVNVTMYSKGGLAMQLKIGDGGDEDLNKFMQCAYVEDASGSQVVGQGIYGKTLILGFPEDDVNAPWIPPAEKEFTDPIAFRAEVDGKTLVYEHFAFGVEDNRSLYTDPSYFARQLMMFLSVPAWFNAGNASDANVHCTMHSSFGDNDKARCREFSAIAVNYGMPQAGDAGKVGTKLDLNGWNPAHYWMPGYFNEVKDTKLVLRTDGQYSVPKQLCFGTGDWKHGCASEAGEGDPGVREQHDSVSTAFQAPGAVSYLNPNSTDFGIVELRSYECLTFAELQSNGYVKTGMSEEAAKFPEPEKKFCVVKGQFMENIFENSDHNTETFTKILDVTSASLFWAGEPRRLNAQGAPRQFDLTLRQVEDDGFDVTDFIYAGARPGHNAEDTMKPFDQLGAAYKKLPSDPSVFAPMPKLYDSIYERR